MKKENTQSPAFDVWNSKDSTPSEKVLYAIEQWGRPWLTYHSLPDNDEFRQTRMELEQQFKDKERMMTVLLGDDTENDLNIRRNISAILFSMTAPIKDKDTGVYIQGMWGRMSEYRDVTVESALFDTLVKLAKAVCNPSTQIKQNAFAYLRTTTRNNLINKLTVKTRGVNKDTDLMSRDLKVMSINGDDEHDYMDYSESVAQKSASRGSEEDNPFIDKDLENFDVEINKTTFEEQLAKVYKIAKLSNKEMAVRELLKQNKPTTEVAHILGLNYNTVVSLDHRSSAKLKRAIKAVLANG